MSLHAPASAEWLVVDTSNDAVLKAVERIRASNEEIDPLLIESADEGIPYDRRKSRRIQLRMPVILIPVEELPDHEERLESCGPEQIAVTRDLSAQGLGLVHDMQLLSDLALLQFDVPGNAPIRLLYEVRWSERKTQYSYVSGGRLMGIVESHPSPKT